MIGHFKILSEETEEQLIEAIKTGRNEVDTAKELGLSYSYVNKRASRYWREIMQKKNEEAKNIV